ncbi:hypothetical protein OIE49_02655 [Streptomyces sp. NBC_01788]|uniref:hypothetical protein n=1 Tax=Streptomyces sp. NBC_01788 TaxID=2975940 RepID=UPI002DDA8757|nr:hypothetical protein [Streptomyces sp. NBC_01788]WSB24881.1 hypothetical protein OIE49_02655 [Streptomyces sp. NBC_01788]
MYAGRGWASTAVAVAGAVMLFATACEGPSALADGDKGKASPGASTQATRTPATPSGAKSSPNPDFAAFQAKPCPKLTNADLTRGDLITTVIDPREGITVLPGGEPQTVLVKLCNTTGKALRYIALSAQVEWNYAGEREPRLTMERREAPDGDWHPDGLRVANDDDPLTGASGARDLPAHGTRVVEYRISAAEDAPAGQGRFGIHAVRTDWNPFYTDDPRGGGHGAFQLTIAPRE